jgi:MFS family permease
MNKASPAVGRTVPSSEHTRFNFAMGLFHGIFFQAGMAFSSPTTVLPVFLNHFTGSLALIGLFSAVVTAGGVFPQLFVAHRMQGRQRGKSVLVSAIWVRAGAWAILGALTWMCAGCGSTFILVSLLVLLLTFSVAGGIANVPFTGIWGKTIPARLRGRFWGHRQLWGGLLALGSGYVVKRVLSAPLAFPKNYALLFLLSFLLIALSYVALSSVREPPGTVVNERKALGAFLKEAASLFRRDRDFGRFAVVQAATMFFQFSMPFYVLYGRKILGMATEDVGILVAAQVGGAIASNLLWGWLSDRFGNRSVIRLTAVATLLLPAIALLSQSVGWAMLVVVFILSGMVISGQGIGFVNYVLEIAPEPDRPTYIALSGTLNGLLAMLPIVGGWVVDAGSYQLSFGIALAAAAVAVGLSFGLKCLRPDNSLR